ncbi:MAG: hypothetical protein ACPGYV_14600 [Phycisphaeraceae bacterium]
MSSWVRYSIAVYVGLLISGALARQPWQGATSAPPPPSVSHDRDDDATLSPPTRPRPNAKPVVERDVAVKPPTSDTLSG